MSSWAEELSVQSYLRQARSFYQRNVYRVSQLDATLLDTQLLKLLNGQMERLLKSLPKGAQTALKPELQGLLELLVLAWSLSKNGGSPGMAMQGLRLTRRDGGKLDFERRMWLLCLVVGAKYAFQRLKRFCQRLRGRPRFKAALRRGLSTAEGAFRALSLLNFLLFLVRGEYPTLPLRLLGAKLRYTSGDAGHVANGTRGRSINFSFLNRTVVWAVLSEVALLVLPMVDWDALGNRLAETFVTPAYRIVRRGSAAASRGGAGAEAGGCAACGAATPANAYVASCGHLFCYYCLRVQASRAREDRARASSAAAADADVAFRCPRCTAHVSEARRFRPRDVS